jgi:hypothetical protein
MRFSAGCGYSKLDESINFAGWDQFVIRCRPAAKPGQIEVPGELYTEKRPQEFPPAFTALGGLGYFFDACRTGRVTAFASDLRLTRSGIAARFTAVFLATFHEAGAGNVSTGVFLLRGCHKFLLHSLRNEKNAGYYSAIER